MEIKVNCEVEIMEIKFLELFSSALIVAHVLRHGEDWLYFVDFSSF